MRAFDNILTHRPTDTAPLLRYVERLCFILMGLVDDGYYRKAEAAAQAIYSAVRVICGLEWANNQRRLKLDMLSHKYWRRQVLRELGGERALARWEAAEARVNSQRLGFDIRPFKPRLKPRLQTDQINDNPAKHPLIQEEPYRMDFAGAFRLAPLPRFNRIRKRPPKMSAPCQPRPKVIPPIRIWPAEFRAAEAWDYARWLRQHAVTMKAVAASKIIMSKVSAHVKSRADSLEVFLQRLPLSLRALLRITLHQDRAHEAAT